MVVKKGSAGCQSTPKAVELRNQVDITWKHLTAQVVLELIRDPSVPSPATYLQIALHQHLIHYPAIFSLLSVHLLHAHNRCGTVCLRWPHTLFVILLVPLRHLGVVHVVSPALPIVKPNLLVEELFGIHVEYPKVDLLLHGHLLAAQGCLCQTLHLLVPAQSVFHVEDLQRVRRC